MDKAALRRWGRERRRVLALPGRAAAGSAIAKRVVELPELEAPTRVLAYAAVGAEAPTAELVAALWARGHRVALPRIDDAAAGQMSAVEVAADAVLAVGLRGVPTPPAGPTMHDPVVVVVPGVVFCPDTGARLGQGGGFYDRYLARHPGALAVGLAFAAQCHVAAHDTAEPHDRAVDVLVTETSLRRFPRPA